jgi:phage/plasmid-like protein (TIGR03299 family)
VTYPVSQAYAADGEGPMVYGSYRDHGYTVAPLTDKLGTTVSNVSASQAFELAGLNWTADKRPAFFMGADGPKQSQEHCAVVRSDNDSLLGIHGRGYTPIQNTALIEVLDYLREDIKLENVLSIRGGRKIFATASIEAESEVVTGDKVRRYLHLFNSHDASSSFGIFFSDVRLICANQLRFLTGEACRNAEAEGAGLRVRHTSGAARLIQSLPGLIDLQRRSFASSINELRHMADVQLNTELARRILETTYADKLARPHTDRKSGDKRPRTLADLPEITAIHQHYAGDTGYGIRTTPGAAGTVYGLFNAITQYETHDAGRAKSEVERARTRLESLWGGTSAKRIDIARQVCLSC